MYFLVPFTRLTGSEPVTGSLLKKRKKPVRKNQNNFFSNNSVTTAGKYFDNEEAIIIKVITSYWFGINKRKKRENTFKESNDVFITIW